ncbi:MAG: hypothetical protein ACREQ9_05470, partial [Candidatus Binatia bacterium]
RGVEAMAVYLKSIAALVVLFGVLTGFRFVSLVVGDETFAKAALARERNAGNILYESEYRVAEAGRIFLIYSAVSCFMTALIGGSLLWGLGTLHSKVDRRG